MSLHPLQSLACVDREGARRLLNASPVKPACGGSHRVRKTSPGVLLARFRRYARLEIGELRREERASLGAGEMSSMGGGSALASIAWRAHSPAPESAMTQTAARAADADRKDMTNSGSGIVARSGLAARCFRRMSLLLQRMTKKRLGPGPEIFGYKFLLARSLASDRLRLKIVPPGARF